MKIGAFVLLSAMLKRLMTEEEFNPFLQNNPDKLILVKFFTTWCPPCQELQKSISEVLTVKNNLMVLEVDAEKFPELTQRPEFNVRSVPTIFLFQQGKIIRKGGGSMSVSQLKEFINV